MQVSRKRYFFQAKLVNLLKGLELLVTSFAFKRFENIWGNYYEEAATRTGYLEEKKKIISSWLVEQKQVKTVIDIGGNKGEFSMLAPSDQQIICADGEHHAVEKLYQKIKKENIQHIVPLCIDFTSPSPAIGVNNEERNSFLDQGKSDLAMALALIHHLAIGKNIPFALIAKMCAGLGKILIIEFVPKDDEKALLLLQNKKDIYDWYREDRFVHPFLLYLK